MNFRVREVVKSTDIFKTCDLMAFRNADGSYFIVYNRHSSRRDYATESEFKVELIKSKEPIVLSTALILD